MNKEFRQVMKVIGTMKPADKQIMMAMIDDKLFEIKKQELEPIRKSVNKRKFL